MTMNRLTINARKIALALPLVMLLSACSQTSDWIKDRVSTSSEEPQLLGAQEIDTYITELGQIASGDPAAQAEIYADAATAAQLTPSPATNLRLGLVLAIPGHPESDPERAQSILREVMTQTLLLTPGELALATIHLNSVERQIVANIELNRLRTSTSRAAQSQQQTNKRRMAAIETENQRLRNELAEAEQKLEAITSIERSIREQE